jgi:hypothetical protein
MEMKVNYPNDKENTSEDSSDNFHNIENFVIKNNERQPHFFYLPLSENRRWSEHFKTGQNHTHTLKIVFFRFGSSEAQVNSFVLKFLSSRSTFTDTVRVFNCHDPSKNFYLGYGSI